MNTYGLMAACALVPSSGLPPSAQMARQHGAKCISTARLMSRMLATAVTTAVFVLSSLCLGKGAAYAHARLQRSAPREGSTVIPAPNHVAIWFTERLEPAFSGVEVHDAERTRVDQGKREISGSSMRTRKPSNST